MWLEFEGFFDLIKEWWEETQPHGFASYVIASKLKYIKAKLKVWNREIFGDIRVKKHKLLEAINFLDLKEESTSLSSEEFLIRSVGFPFWRKFLEDRNLELCGFVQGTETPSSSTGSQICIGSSTPFLLLRWLGSVSILYQK